MFRIMLWPVIWLSISGTLLLASIILIVFDLTAGDPTLALVMFVVLVANAVEVPKAINAIRTRQHYRQELLAARSLKSAVRAHGLKRKESRDIGDDLRVTKMSSTYYIDTLKLLTKKHEWKVPRDMYVLSSLNKGYMLYTLKRFQVVPVDVEIVEDLTARIAARAAMKILEAA